MDRTTSAVVSTFRKNYTVETLTRILNVTGKDFPISGDAPLRFQKRMEQQGYTQETTC